MILTRRQTLMSMTAALTLTGLTGRRAIAATTQEVDMLNASPDGSKRWWFEPALLQIAPGDTVRFLPTDPGHNAQTYDDLVPEGGTTFRGQINKEVEATFETAGTYAYYCLPHQALGMVGLILVGDHTTNLEAVRAGVQDLRRPQEKERLNALLDEAEAMA